MAEILSLKKIYRLEQPSSTSLKKKSSKSNSRKSRDLSSSNNSKRLSGRHQDNLPKKIEVQEFSHKC